MFIPELIQSMLDSTRAGAFGVGLIFIYFAWMMGMAIRNIRRTMAEDKH